MCKTALAILLLLALCTWRLCAPDYPPYRSPTAQEVQRIEKAWKYHGQWPVESYGDRLYLQTDKGKVWI